MRKRTCWTLSWKGWACVLFATALLGWAWALRAYGFLAPQQPLSGGVEVVEGWGDDEMMRFAIGEMRRRGFSRLYVTGGDIGEDTPWGRFGTFAELGASTVRALSEGTIEPQAVPAPRVEKDRTYTSALALRRWMEASGGVPAEITVISAGPHSRRTRLLFQHAFAGRANVGVIAAPPRDYDPNQWWTNGEGFRAVMAESIAYVYARVLFRP